MISKEVLEATALIRVIECTNGCIQYAFRDGDKNALSVEKSRECMKISMGTIKNKVLQLSDGTEIVFPKECHGILNEVRDLYIRGFKKGDSDALEEFFASSKAHFQVLGRKIIDEKFNLSTLKKHIKNTDYLFISDLLKSKDLKRKIISFDVNSKRKIIK